MEIERGGWNYRGMDGGREGWICTWIDREMDR